MPGECGDGGDEAGVAVAHEFPGPGDADEQRGRQEVADHVDRRVGVRGEDGVDASPDLEAEDTQQQHDQRELTTDPAPRGRVSQDGPHPAQGEQQTADANHDGRVPDLVMRHQSEEGDTQGVSERQQRRSRPDLPDDVRLLSDAWPGGHGEGHEQQAGQRARRPGDGDEQVAVCPSHHEAQPTGLGRGGRSAGSRHRPGAPGSAGLAGGQFGSQVGAQVGAQDAVPDPVPPGAVPPADAAQQAFPGEPGLLQGPLLGDVARLGGRLDPVDRGVREQVAHQQPLRLSAVPMAAGLREQSDADLPVVGVRGGPLDTPVHEPQPFPVAGHDEGAAVVAEQAVVRPAAAPAVAVPPPVPAEGSRLDRVTPAQFLEDVQIVLHDRLQCDLIRHSQHPAAPAGPSPAQPPHRPGLSPGGRRRTRPRRPPRPGRRPPRRSGAGASPALASRWSPRRPGAGSQCPRRYRAGPRC